MNGVNPVSDKLKEIIKRGWLTKNKHVNLEAIARELSLVLVDVEEEKQNDLERKQMMTLIEKHLTEKWKELLKS